MLSGTRAGNALAVLLDRYEAAIPWNPDRAWVPGFVRDARFDANSFSRWEMDRKILYFERNSWLVKRIRDEFVKWTAGPNGLQIIPHSSDTEWNKPMLEAYLEWCEKPCLDSTLTMPQVHRLEAGSFHLLGEVFVNETRRKLTGQPSRPAIQLIESHRCSSPGEEYALTSDQSLVDGVQLQIDPITGNAAMPLGYWIRDGSDGTSYTFRSTEVMQHIFDPERIGMYRGITPYHASLGDLQDVFEMEMMEMQRGKQNSEVAYFLKTMSGELPPQLARGNRFALASGNTGTAGTTETKDEFQKRIDLYRKIYGSRVVGLKQGEEAQQFDSKSPSAMTQWLWRYKLGQICAAANVPLIIVFPELVEGMQGTVVRGVYDNAHEFFRSQFFIFANAARRKYRFFANWARYNDPRCVDAPADWARCHVIPPRAVNVDIGRNSQAMLAELQAGTTSYDDVAGAKGSTAEVLFRSKARSIAMAKQIAREVSKETKEEVKPEEIIGQLADIVQKLAAAEAQQQAPDPNADDQPAKTKGEPVAA